MKKIWILIFILFFTIKLPLISQSLEELKKIGKIRIGCKDSFRPFGFIDDNGKWVGFDIDIAKELSQKLEKDFGLKTEWIKINRSSDRITFLKEKKVDIVIASFSITPERKKEIDFSIPYFLNEGLAILTLKNSPIRRLEDLKGKKVVTTGGSTAEKFLKKELPEAKIITTSNDDKAMDLLLSGKAIAYLQDKSVCDYHLLRNIELRELGKIFKLTNRKDYYGFGLQKGNKKLVEYCNNFISQLKDSGKYQQIYNKWFSRKGINEENWKKTISFLEAVAYRLILENKTPESMLAGEILKNFAKTISFQHQKILNKYLTKESIYLKNGMMFQNVMILKQTDTYVEILDEKNQYYLIPYSSINFIKGSRKEK